jgi:hypothetical protein
MRLFTQLSVTLLLLLGVSVLPASTQCRPGYGLCPGGGCAPLGNVCCPGGTHAPAGSICCPGGTFARPGYICCPDRGSCPSNSICTNDGGCLLRISERVCADGSYCNRGFICIRGNQCLSVTSERYCGGRKYCEVGFACIDEGATCIEVTSKRYCGNGRYCDPGYECVSDGKCRREQRLNRGSGGVGTAARGGAPALPYALSGGQATTFVYLGIRSGNPVYVGITTNIARRQAQHGARFVLTPITTSPLTRGQARAIEQAMIVRNPQFENVINSISPKHPWYKQAVDWGEWWLRTHGF